MIVDFSKTCWCHTCEKAFHPLGIMRHRAMHRDRKEDCVITFTEGQCYRYNYGFDSGAKNAAS